MSPKKRFEAALAAGDWAAAEGVLRHELAVSGDPRVLLMLATFLRNHGRLVEAEALVAPAVETAPTAELLNHLALIQYERRDFAASEKTLDRLVAMAPSGAGLAAYRLAAKVKRVVRGDAAAREILLNAAHAHPGRADFMIAYADTLPAEEAIAALEKYVSETPLDPGSLANLRYRIMLYRAPLVRRMRGLADYGVSWADTYRWPDSDSLGHLKAALDAQVAAGAKGAATKLLLAYAAAAEGDWDSANAHLAGVRSGTERTPADFTAFGKAFHSNLDAVTDADIFAGLAPVQRILAPPPQTGETLFVSSDPKYFVKFTIPFLRRLDAMAAPADVHVHLLDGPESEWASAREALGAFSNTRVTLTAEASGVAAQGAVSARTYYHAVRYLRLFEELQRCRSPMWILDVDIHVQRDPRPLFTSLAHADVAMRTHPCAFESVMKIAASCIGVAPTPLGIAYARRVAAYITHWRKLGTWGWGIDQVALFSSYAHMDTMGTAPETLFLDDTAITGPTGNSGILKHDHGVDKYVNADTFKGTDPSAP